MAVRPLFQKDVGVELFALNRGNSLCCLRLAYMTDWHDTVLTGIALHCKQNYLEVTCDTSDCCPVHPASAFVGGLWTGVNEMGLRLCRGALCDWQQAPVAGCSLAGAGSENFACRFPVGFFAPSKNNSGATPYSCVSYILAKAKST